jgi:hypothetical protein
VCSQLLAKLIRSCQRRIIELAQLYLLVWLHLLQHALQQLRHLPLPLLPFPQQGSRLRMHITSFLVTRELLHQGLLGGRWVVRVAGRGLPILSYQPPHPFQGEELLH